MATEHTGDDRRRLRRALFGREPLTRADAELLAGRFPYNDSTASKVGLVLGPVAIAYFAVPIVLGIAHDSPISRLAIPIVFVALGIPALIQRLRVRHKIQQALARPTD